MCQLYLPKPKLFLEGFIKLIDWLEMLGSDGWLDGDLFALSKLENVLLGLKFGGTNCCGGR